MSRKSINSEEEKNQQKQFLQKQKSFKIEDIDIHNILVSKKESYGKKIHLNTSLVIMMIMPLDHYG